MGYSISVPTERGANKDALDSCTYRKSIDIPYAIEIISELYGDVLPLLNKSSLIYGGIIRDIVAGMFPLEGDLDIIISPMSYRSLIEKFSSCNKIIKVSNTKGSIVYGKSSSIGSVQNFKTIDGRLVQIIRPTSSVLDLVTSTDLVCCGVVMTSEGEVLEVIRGAEEACNKHILTLNKGGNINISSVCSRIKKLKKRGWKSEVSMTEIKKFAKSNAHNKQRKTNKPIWSTIDSKKLTTPSKRYSTSESIDWTPGYKIEETELQQGEVVVVKQNYIDYGAIVNEVLDEVQIDG